MIQISADRQRARCVRSANERITTGLTGKTVSFHFGAGWENVTARTAVFEGSGTVKDCTIEDGAAIIPHECLTVPGGVLRVGVYGTAGTQKTPTVYAEIGQIERGADPSGDPSTDPTLSVWEQIRAEMGDLADLETEDKSSLVAAINEAAASGGGGGGSVTKDSIVTALGYTPEDAANKTTALSASSTVAEYPSAKAVWDAIPHPEDKTDAMTQAVGKDADGKLWTAPGGGSGGGGSAFSLIRSLTLTEQTDRVDITTGDSGSAFVLTEVYVAVEAQSYTETAEEVIFLPNGLWASSNPYITSSSKPPTASESWKSGMTFHAACLGNQMAFAEQCQTKGNNSKLESKIGTIRGAAITKISLVSKLTAGCTVTVYGR